MKIQIRTKSLNKATIHVFWIWKSAGSEFEFRLRYFSTDIALAFAVIYYVCGFRSKAAVSNVS